MAQLLMPQLRTKRSLIVALRSARVTRNAAFAERKATLVSLAIVNRFLFWLCLFSVLAASPAGAVDGDTVVGETAATSWPRFLGNTFDGVAVEAGFRWTEKPKFRWSIRLGDGYGIGSVSGDKFFQLDEATGERNQSVERLRCFDLSTGETIWTSTQSFFYQDLLGYENGPRSSPTISGNDVYTMGATGKLTRRNADDGEMVWTVDTNKKYDVVQNFFGVGCSPLLLGDQLIVTVGGSPPEDQNVGPGELDRVSANGSAVVAFDKNTGKEIWKCGDDLASYSSPRPIDIDGETLVLVFARAGLMAIDPREGEVRWRFDHRASIRDSVNAMMPVVDGDLVLISECYEVGSALLKITARSRDVVWRDRPARRPREQRLQTLRAHWATPILIDGNLYGCSGRNPPDCDFRCVDFKTGDIKWTDPRRIRSSVTRVGDHLLVLEERGILRVIDPNPSELRTVAEWDLGLPDGDRPAIGYPCWAAPIVVGNKLILRGTSKVLCLELATN